MTWVIEVNEKQGVTIFPALFGRISGANRQFFKKY
jgi:hypothetical protein